MNLWKRDDFIALIKGRPIGVLPEMVSGLSIDSRTIASGEAFFAIRGEQFDGHDYIRVAGHAGAALAVISERKLAALGTANVPLVVVRDVVGAMTRLGEAARARTQAKIIAVTGSVGKTSTKQMLHDCLSSVGKIHASVASFNNHWGVPLTLARMPEDTEFGIFEIGMNNPGEIIPLTAMVRPHIALVNNIAAAHLESFSTLNDVARAKAEIFSGLVSGGAVVLNRDGEHYDLLVELAREAGIKKIVSFGEKIEADFRLVDFVANARGSKFLACLENGEQIAVNLSISGRHMALNAMAVLACASLADVSIEPVIGALSSVMPIKGRGNQIKLSVGGGTAILIDESYNANPASMAAAMEVLATMPLHENGRRIAVLGDMLELGEDSGKWHRDLQKTIHKAGIDTVFLAGQEMAQLRNVLPAHQLGGYAVSAKELGPMLLESVRRDDVLMMKASNTINFAHLVNLLHKTYPHISSF